MVYLYFVLLSAANGSRAFDKYFLQSGFLGFYNSIDTDRQSLFPAEFNINVMVSITNVFKRKRFPAHINGIDDDIVRFARRDACSVLDNQVDPGGVVIVEIFHERFSGMR